MTKTLAGSILLGAMLIAMALPAWPQEPPECPLDQVSRPVNPVAPHQPGDCTLDMQPMIGGGVTGVMRCPVDGGAHGHVLGSYGAVEIGGQTLCMLDISIQYPRISITDDPGAEWYVYNMGGGFTLTVESRAAACADPEYVDYWTADEDTVNSIVVRPRNATQFACDFNVTKPDGEEVLQLGSVWNNRQCQGDCVETERQPADYEIAGQWVTGGGGDPDNWTPVAPALVIVGGGFPNIETDVPLPFLDDTE